MTAFLLSLIRVGVVAALAAAVGWLSARALLPAGEAFRLERLAWGFAMGMALLAAFVPLSLLAGVRPGWIPFSALGVALLALTRFVAPPTLTSPPAGGGREARALRPPLRILLRLLVLLGVAFYAVQALTEPMWSNDFIAIWGLKAKSIALTGSLPDGLRRGPDFAHPEYPLGLPFLYAGVALLTGGWDDHALALLFPLVQAATLAAAAGWLRRRGAPPAGILLAAAILANFGPLYSAFLTGLAEVPLAFGLLLFGTALADALEPAAPGALRRLALAAAILAATKNEGLYLAAAGCLVGLVFGGGRRRLRIAAAALPTALLVHIFHLIWRGRLPLRDFDLGLFSLDRLTEALSTAARIWGPAGWAGAALVAALVVLGARRAESDGLLALLSLTAAAYLLLPAFAVRGPAWLVQTTLGRLTAALAPLAAAAIVLRYAPEREKR